MSEVTIHPDVLAMVVCDQIITDQVTRKQSLIGVFSTIHGFRFPLTQPQLCVHLSLTDGHGKTPILIRIVDSDETRPPIIEGKAMVEFKNPRAIANLALQFHGLTFPRPGEYRVQLYSGNELLREIRMALLLAKPRPGRSGPQARPPSFTDPPDGGDPPQ